MMTRRGFLKTGARTGLLFALPQFEKRLAYAAPAPDPHFFLHIFIIGGIDASYFFDARPLTMTDKGHIANYLYKGPTALAGDLATPKLYTGVNGNSCLRTSLTDDLMVWKNYFSVVNGVHMSTKFDGHGNNASMLFSNSPAQMQDSFVPIIGQSLAKKMGPTPLDAIHFGQSFGGDSPGTPSNFSLSVQLSAPDLSSLIEGFTKSPFTPDSNNYDQMLLNQMHASAGGAGLYSLGSRKLAEAAARIPLMLEKLKVAQSFAKPIKNASNNDNQNADNNGNDEVDVDMLGTVETALSFFKAGVMTSATVLVDYDPKIDVHGAEAAGNSAALYRPIVKQINDVFKLLHDDKQVYDAARNLKYADVVTVLITSEFSRTTRQLQRSLTETGTDHNPLTNFVLCAGKNIKGGKVIGATDFHLDRGGKLTVSKAHRDELDKAMIKIAGSPYDFDGQKVSAAMPETFAPEQYINIANVVNTVMFATDVPSDKYFGLPNDARTKAPVIKELVDG